jgi:hypothetical protein
MKYLEYIQLSHGISLLISNSEIICLLEVQIVTSETYLKVPSFGKYLCTEIRKGNTGALVLQYQHHFLIESFEVGVTDKNSHILFP